MTTVTLNITRLSITIKTTWHSASSTLASSTLASRTLASSTLASSTLSINKIQHNNKTTWHLAQVTLTINETLSIKDTEHK